MFLQTTHQIAIFSYSTSSCCFHQDNLSSLSEKLCFLLAHFSVAALTITGVRVRFKAFKAVQ